MKADCKICEFKFVCPFYGWCLNGSSSYVDCHRFKQQTQTALNVQQGCEGFD